ncbi:hypothetical protein DY000_02013087, partial [Brassica cretica]
MLMASTTSSLPSLFRSGNQNSSYQILYRLYSMALCALNSVLEQGVAKAVFLTGAPSSHPSFLPLKLYLYLTHAFSCAIDHGDQILGKLSLELNSSLFHPQAIVNVRDLNWMSEWPVQDTHPDVIYSDDLTIALFSMLKRVMSLGCDKVLYLGLEKRYNFSLDDLNVVANGYACFRRYIKEDMLPFYTCDKKSSFVGKRIDLKQIPQYTKAYDRGEDVELWEIKY